MNAKQLIALDAALDAAGIAHATVRHPAAEIIHAESTYGDARRTEIEEPTYRIMRYFIDSDVVPQRVPGLDKLTLAQAKEYCSSKLTQCAAWFDGCVENE